MQNISVSSIQHSSHLAGSIQFSVIIVQHKVKAPQGQGQGQGQDSSLCSPPRVTAALPAVVAALDHGAIPGHLGLTPRRPLNLGLEHTGYRHRGKVNVQHQTRKGGTNDGDFPAWVSSQILYFVALPVLPANL